MLFTGKKGTLPHSRMGFSQEGVQLQKIILLIATQKNFITFFTWIAMYMVLFGMEPKLV